jgi:hypothetical protein
MNPAEFLYNLSYDDFARMAPKFYDDMSTGDIDQLITGYLVRENLIRFSWVFSIGDVYKGFDMGVVAFEHSIRERFERANADLSRLMPMTRMTGWSASGRGFYVTRAPDMVNWEKSFMEGLQEDAKFYNAIKMSDMFFIEIELERWDAYWSHPVEPIVTVIDSTVWNESRLAAMQTITDRASNTLDNVTMMGETINVRRRARQATRAQKIKKIRLLNIENLPGALLDIKPAFTNEDVLEALKTRKLPDWLLEHKYAQFGLMENLFLEIRFDEDDDLLQEFRIEFPTVASNDNFVAWEQLRELYATFQGVRDLRSFLDNTRGEDAFPGLDLYLALDNTRSIHGFKKENLIPIPK